METIRLELQATSALSADEILDIVGQQKLATLKLADPNPYLTAYVVAHEGISRPKQIGVGARVFRWGRAAIQSLHESIADGLSFFLGHNHDNSTEGRPSYGKVIGKALKEVGGKLASVVIAYSPKDCVETLKKAGAVSIEMEALCKQADDGTMEAVGEFKTTGIALAIGQRPAWEGAIKLAEIQAFEAIGEPKKMPYETIAEALQRASLSEIREAVRERDFWPHQIFDEERIIGKPTQFGDKIEYKGGDKLINAYREQYEAQLKSKTETELGKWRAEALRLQAGPKVEEYLRAKNMPEPVLKLARIELPNFTPTEDIERSVAQFGDQVIQRHETLMRTVGYQVGAPADTTTVAQPADEAQKPKDMSAPENNPWIPK